MATAVPFDWITHYAKHDDPIDTWRPMAEAGKTEGEADKTKCALKAPFNAKVEPCTKAASDKVKDFGGPFEKASDEAAAAAAPKPTASAAGKKTAASPPTPPPMQKRPPMPTGLAAAIKGKGAAPPPPPPIPKGGIPDKKKPAAAGGADPNAMLNAIRGGCPDGQALTCKDGKAPSGIVKKKCADGSKPVCKAANALFLETAEKKRFLR